MNAFNPLAPDMLALPSLDLVLLVLALLAAAPLLIRPIGRMYGLSGYQSGGLAVAFVALAIIAVRTLGSFGFSVVQSVVFGVAALLALPFILRASGSILGLPGRVLGAIWRAAVGLFTPSPISRRIAGVTPEGVAAWLRKSTRDSRDPMLQGDRLAAAEARWSRTRYPFLYQTIPADVRRSVVWDGRIVGGFAVTWLAWRHLSADVVAQVFRSAGRRALRAGAAVALVGVAAVLAYTLSFGYRAPAPYPAWSEGVSLMPRVNWYLLVVIDEACRVGLNLGLVLLGAIILTPALMYFAFWRSLHSWWQGATAALATPTRDSLVLYKHKADAREVELSAYARQVDLAIRGQDRGLPLIQIGTGTGIARARGEMRGPTQGQPVCLDGISIRQHTIIFGGTGEGKTEDVIKPLAERIFAADWGTGNAIGGYVTDGKGVLFQEIAELPSIKRRSDVRILGTGPDHYGVNLVEGMSPLEVSTTLSTLTTQVMGDEGEAFWSELAATIFYHAAVLAQLLELDHESQQSPEWSAYRPWSVLGISHLATDPDAITRAAQRVQQLDTDRGNASPDLLALVDSDETFTSVQYVIGTWAGMAAETRGSVIANVTVVTGKLAGAGLLRERFCTGRLPAAQVVDVDHALNGGIVMIAVGESDWGLPGRVVAIWLKTRLYVAARRKQRVDPEGCKRVSVAVIADEFQMLATGGGAESDAEFWNVARSTGCFLVAATQSIASLQKRLNETVTTDLLNNLRTKICLRLEDKATLDYCSALAGSSLRGIVSDDAFYETQGQREIERPDRSPGVSLPAGLTFGGVLPVRPSLNTTPQRTASSLDKRFILDSKDLGGRQDSNQAILGSQQAAMWRQEDKERELRGSGLQDRPVFTPGDLKIGSGFAFAYTQRASGHSIDIVDLRAAKVAA